MPPTVRRMLVIFPALAISAVCNLAVADQYDAPATYYQNATGTGATLKSQLFTITSTGFIARTYGDARYAEAITDRDPANASNILLVYNRASVSGTWDFGVTFNREHVWPKSLLGLTSNDVTNSYAGVASDQFELRPSNPTINSNRSNWGYGKITAAKPAAGYGIVSSGGTYWYPGDADRGDVARSIFYMATRYGQGQAHNLTLVNGAPSTYQMGDKESLLHYMYEDPVDTFERARNQSIYSQTLNPQYYQNNRNPFIDHPEYVWSIFGTEANNSRLSVGAQQADGSSTADVNLGKVIAGSTFGTQTVTLSKTGSTPTTFDATVAGSATSTLNTPRNSFDYNAGSKPVTVGFSGSTATTGARSGTIVFNNTDLTTAGAGQGSADGNDTINVTGSVVSHARPSVSLAQDSSTQTIDLGIFAQGSSGTDTNNTFGIVNRGTANEFVAGLDIDSVSFASGEAAAFTTDLAASSNLAVGEARTFTATAVTDVLGVHAVTYSLATSDENIPGAMSLTSLSTTLTSRIAIGGDANLGDSVGFEDLVIVAQNYDANGTVWQTGDFNRTGTTDFSDLIVLAQNYGIGAAAVADSFGSDFAADWVLAQSLVPEPIVMMPALFGLTLLRRRR
jgi:endonuclease I